MVTDMKKCIEDNGMKYNNVIYRGISFGFGLLARSSAAACTHSLEQKSQFFDILNFFPSSPVLQE